MPPLEASSSPRSSWFKKDQEHVCDIEAASSLIQHREHNDQKHTVEHILLLVRRYILLLGNIGTWYTTNGMNGISMQTFAAKMPSVEGEGGVTPFTKVAVTVLVTALQLLLGALLGRILLYLYTRLILAPSAASSSTDGSSSSTTIEPAPPASRKNNFWSATRAQTMLAALHAAGSVCTNLGFMNGKASLVQVIKLFEPFETLLFTKLLIKQEGDLFSTGVVSSMCLTLGAALSLLPNNKKSHATSYQAAIFFATLSGFSLSLRNVLQRRQHAASPQSSPVAQIKDKLERSLVLFTQISLQSGWLLLIGSICALFIASAAVPQSSAILLPTLVAILQDGLNVGLLSWHPLYNAFSMTTLGFCSAVTHSLLNAGKRVYAIIMAIVWFREGFTAQTAAGLFLVTIGGCWYTVEMKGAKAPSTRAKGVDAACSGTDQQSHARRKGPFWVKPLLALVLLHIHWTFFRL